MSERLIRAVKDDEPYLQPATLGELLAWCRAPGGPSPDEHTEGFRLAFEILHGHLRNILYGTDTEPGLVERVVGYTFDNNAPAIKRNVVERLQAEIATPEPTPDQGGVK